jgi:16S rRNA (cytidine1402-2'-O)-methyltransferase
LVASPIGNLGDISDRARWLLSTVDVVAAEDTRVTGKLLNLLGLSARLVAYHEHNADQVGPQLIERIAQGQSVALISDAGSPLISDPGGRLVALCKQRGLPVTAAPGASAVITALQLSGLPAERFLFLGFLPNKTTQRRQAFQEFSTVPATLVAFDSPNRVDQSVADALAVLGDRPAAIARELTKLHEEIIDGALSDLAAKLADRPTLKGEVVLLIGPPRADVVSADDLDALIAQGLAQGLSVKDAAAVAAARTGHPRREAYARALLLANA